MIKPMGKKIFYSFYAENFCLSKLMKFLSIVIGRGPWETLFGPGHEILGHITNVQTHQGLSCSLT